MGEEHLKSASMMTTHLSLPLNPHHLLPQNIAQTHHQPSLALSSPLNLHLAHRQNLPKLSVLLHQTMAQILQMHQKILQDHHGHPLFLPTQDPQLNGGMID